MDLQRILTILLRRWWLVLGVPALVLGISLVLLSTAPSVATIRVYVLIPGDTQEPGTAERPELMVLDDIPQLVRTPVFAQAVLIQLQQASPDYVLPASDIQSSLSADYYSRIVTFRATRPDEQEARALIEAVRAIIEREINATLIADGGLQATVRLVEPTTVARDSPTTGTVALIVQTLVALAIGCGLAGIGAAFDQRLHSRGELAAVVPVPILGDLQGERRRRRWPPGRRAPTRPSGDPRATERLRALHTTMASLPRSRPPTGERDARAWLLVGVEGTAGATGAIAGLLATTATDAGERVLVLDADPAPGPGLVSGSATGVMPPGSADAAGTPSIETWLTSSDPTPAPLPVGRSDGPTLIRIAPRAAGADPMRRERWRRLVAEARPSFDLILLTAAPLDGSADALALTAVVDETVLLVEIGETSGSLVVLARASLEAAGGHVSGTVIRTQS